MLDRRVLIPIIAITLLLLPGCSGGEDVNTRSLTKARALWDAAKIRDYDLEWTSSGDRPGHYIAYVRDGKVRSVHAFVDDRRAGATREIEVKRADLNYYGVDGLFRIIQDEHEQCGAGDTPFGQPKGTKVLLKFTPDTKLGYPKRYRRDVVGSARGLALDVIRLEKSTAEVPPPPA